MRSGPAVPAPHPDDPAPVVPYSRHVTVHDQDVAYAGTVRVEAELDLADALDLDHAARLGADRSGRSARCPARRPPGGGRSVTSSPSARFDFGYPDAPDARRRPGGSTSTSTCRPRSRLNLATFVDPLARLEEGHRQVLLDQVKEWCADSHTQVVIRLVLDLAAQ